MPVTSIALALLCLFSAALLTFWAASSWGVVTLLPIALIGIGLARWGLAHVPYDDGRT